MDHHPAAAQNSHPDVAPADPFAALLGTGRGTGTPHGVELSELSPSERARRFIRWTATAIYEDDVEYLKAESIALDELGIEVTPGRWEAEPYGPHHPTTMLLAAVYQDGEPVGFIDVEAGRLLVFAKPDGGPQDAR
jgi:hypothetical protein